MVTERTGEERRDPNRADERTGLRPEEMAPLIYESLESQAGAAASVWTEKFPIEKGPSQAQLEAGARAWLQSLSTQTLEGFRTLCPDTASLIVVPNLPVPALLQLLRKGGTNSKIWWDYWKRVSAGSWNVGITDGAAEMPFEPALYWENEAQERKRTNEAMVAEYKRRFAEKGLGIMPPHGYVPSVARALAGGNVLDIQFYTAFERPTGEALLPGGFWGSDGMDLDWDNPNFSSDDLRCRPWVEGEIKF